MSTAYHLETDGSSEWSNKTITQMLKVSRQAESKGMGLSIAMYLIPGNEYRKCVY